MVYYCKGSLAKSGTRFRRIYALLQLMNGVLPLRVPRLELSLNRAVLRSAATDDLTNNRLSAGHNAVQDVR